VFADDSGLEVEALGGAPGIHSAHYAGRGATDEENRRLLLQTLAPLRLKDGPRPRARFVCAIALALPERLLATFQGSTEGEILEAPRGAGGFGYDPLFYFPALGKTFAELSGREKWAHSHRGKAFRLMLRWIGIHRPELSKAFGAGQ
jgi:XTP/dITP diphosphohydrolase